MKTICKNIFAGIGTITLAVAIIVGVMLAAPVLLVAGGVLIQVGGWILLFGIVVVLPVWGIGKIRNTIKNRRNPIKPPNEAKTTKTKGEFQAVEEGETIGLKDDYEAAVKAEYEEKYKAAIKAKYEQEYNDNLAKINLNKDRKEAFNRKINNLKSKAKTFKADVTSAVTKLVK